MERTLFSFIWKHSAQQQFVLLGVTLITFPFLYATLELPKRIINDAIGAASDAVNFFGVEVSQIQFLLALSFGYLGAVLCHGLLKMRLNTMKGVLAERMLRRFRYQLISRMMRFPKPYFKRTSQGELVSMVTAEAEPMGGLMGDAVAQPVFQAGQMLIIVVFLFLQSVWFGLAGIALIPLQAYIIPILQRQINQLNKKRIIQVRALAAEIGETAAGAADLRTNGGWRFRRAQFTERLGRLFGIRLQVYKKKFFMKFLNNFITQLTPFFFYSVGGVLAIRGEITVGALVAALAAYKDLSSPWKELLTYYNQVQDMSLRWEIVTERFAPADVIDETLFEGQPETIPRLRGPLAFKNVTVRSESGTPILEDVSLDIPAGSRVAIKVPNQTERAALADLLTREVLPTRGSIHLDGNDLSELHQAVIAARIGYAQSRPYFFDGTLGDNLMMSLRTAPAANSSALAKSALVEAERSGNSEDPVDADWTDRALADFANDDDVRAWWFQLGTAMGADEYMMRRMMLTQVDPATHPELTRRVVNLRQEVHEVLQAKGLDAAVNRFDKDAFNPSVPLGGNLLYASPRRLIALEDIVSEGGFLGLVTRQGLAEPIIAMSQTVVETLHETFGKDGTDHPLFQDLGMPEEQYEDLVDIAERRRMHGDAALSSEEFSRLLVIPFLFTAEQIGPAFPDSFKDEILSIRRQNSQQLQKEASDLFVPLAEDVYMPRLTLVENMLFGRISRMAGAQTDLIHDVLAEVLHKHDLRRAVAELVWDMDTGIGGTNLPTAFQERAAFSRAAIKKPDLLVLDKVLASQNAESREEIRQNLADLLPGTTLIFMEDNFASPDNYDIFVEIKNGRIDGVDRAEHLDGGMEGGDDLQRKLRFISETDLFSGLPARSQRLLAFSAQWYKQKKGKKIFRKGDAADAAYLCVKGQAQLVWEDEDGNAVPITTIDPGRLIGDLSVILRSDRDSDMVATEDSVFLRIGAREYLSVVQSDADVAFTLLQTVSTYLARVAAIARDAGAIRQSPEAEEDVQGQIKELTKATQDARQ